MTETVLAEAAIHVGVHEPLWHVLGMTINGDTVISTSIAGIIVIALAFFLKSKVTSTGVPGGVQLFFEAITIQMRQQIEAAIGMKIAPFVLPLAVTIFVFMMVSGRQSSILTTMEQATTRLVDFLASQRPGAQRRGAAS